jgi:hypothetical protein
LNTNLVRAAEAGKDLKYSTDPGSESGQLANGPWGHTAPPPSLSVAAARSGRAASPSGGAPRAASNRRRGHGAPVAVSATATAVDAVRARSRERAASRAANRERASAAAAARRGEGEGRKRWQYKKKHGYNPEVWNNLYQKGLNHSVRQKRQPQRDSDCWPAPEEDALAKKAPSGSSSTRASSVLSAAADAATDAGAHPQPARSRTPKTGSRPLSGRQSPGAPLWGDSFIGTSTSNSSVGGWSSSGSGGGGGGGGGAGAARPRARSRSRDSRSRSRDRGGGGGGGGGGGRRRGGGGSASATNQPIFPADDFRGGQPRTRRAAQLQRRQRAGLRSADGGAAGAGTQRRRASMPASAASGWPPPGVPEGEGENMPPPPERQPSIARAVKGAWRAADDYAAFAQASGVSVSVAARPATAAAAVGRVASAGGSPGRHPSPYRGFSHRSDYGVYEGMLSPAASMPSDPSLPPGQWSGNGLRQEHVQGRREEPAGCDAAEQRQEPGPPGGEPLEVQQHELIGALEHEAAQLRRRLGAGHPSAVRAATQFVEHSAGMATLYLESGREKLAWSVLQQAEKQISSGGDDDDDGTRGGAAAREREQVAAQLLPTLQNGMACCLKRAGRQRAALRLLQKAAAAVQQPGHPPLTRGNVYLNLCATLSGCGKHSEALQAAQRSMHWLRRGLRACEERSDAESRRPASAEAEQEENRGSGEESLGEQGSSRVWTPGAELGRESSGGGGGGGGAALQRERADLAAMLAMALHNTAVQVRGVGFLGCCLRSAR